RFVFFFFFQAEDGIRDFHVTGVQTCALPISGSNGKTTTKNLLRAILEAEAPTVAPEGSFNNQVGAPISMLRIDEATRYLIVEMGASGVGEIARLVSIARPDIGVVLKRSEEHTSELQSR